MSDHVPTPLILDVTVLTELARGDAGIIGLIQHYDGRGQPMVVPALAITGASLAVRTEEAEDLLNGLALMDSITVASLNGTEQSIVLGDVIARTDLDPWDAHTAAIADVSVCPILTLDGARWQHPSMALDEPLHVIEIADPDR